MRPITEREIDLGGRALRDRQQSGKRLTPWEELPNSTKKKWREHAHCVLMAAAAAASI